MMATTDPQAATPGWYPWPDGGVGYWDGWRWTGEHRERPPRTPWTTWLAWALVALALVEVDRLSLSTADVGAGHFLVAGGLPGLAAVLLAANDVRRGRQRRFPTGLAKALLWVPGVLVALMVAGTVVFAIGAAAGGG